MEVGLLSVGGAYKTDKWEASAKLGMHAWNITYLHKSSKVKNHDNIHVLWLVNRIIAIRSSV